MTILPRRGLAVRKALFTLLLGIIVIAIVYTVRQSGPWRVPEEAKHVPNPLHASDIDLKPVRSLYFEKCANCHGDAGKGDGHDAALYDPAPTNFTEVAHMGAVSDGEMFYKISEGRRPMPAFKKKLSEEQRWRLVLLIRSFGATDAEPRGTSNAPPTPSNSR